MTPTTTPTARELRLVDLGARRDREGLLAGLRDGFFLVRHDIEEALLDEAYGLLRTFFELPTEDKLASRVPGSNGQSGYLPPLVEKGERGTVPDWKELFHWSDEVPRDHPVVRQFPHRYPAQHLPDVAVPGLGDALRAVHGRLLGFQLRVLAEIGDALGLHPDYFVEMLDQGPVVNRASWYPPMSAAPSTAHVWAIPHLDFDLITTLPRATTPGLEVLVDDTWVRAVAPPEHAVVNVGMVLERLTGGLARAALHRVAAEPGQAEGRLSIVQFCHPAPWTVLTPAVPGGGGIRYPALTADALFQRTMWRINRREPPQAAP